MTSNYAKLVRRGLVRHACPCESCSSNIDDFVPTPEGLNKLLPEQQQPAKFDGMTCRDMRAAKDFLFAPDPFQKFDAAKRLQNEHVITLAKKYYQPRKS